MLNVIKQEVRMEESLKKRFVSFVGLSQLLLMVI